jgi:hypothetical protein
MGDFRIGSVSPAGKFRDKEPPDSFKRKKARRPEGQTSERDDVATLSEPAEPGAEPAEDYYSPAGETEEPK